MILIIDKDGVLTDGKVYVTHKGEKFKAFNNKDNTAIAELIQMGYEVHIVTASSWPGMDKYCHNLGVKTWIIRDKSNLDAITGGKPYMAVGDSAWDIEMLKKAAKKFCPLDAEDEVKALDKMIVLNRKGGDGVILELLKWL